MRGAPRSTACRPHIAPTGLAQSQALRTIIATSHGGCSRTSYRARTPSLRPRAQAEAREQLWSDGLLMTSLAQRFERRAHLLAEELGFLPRGEVATLVDLVEVDDVRVQRLDPAARRPPDLARERRETDRDRRRRQRLLAGRRRVWPVGVPVRSP